MPQLSTERYVYIIPRNGHSVCTLLFYAKLSGGRVIMFVEHDISN